MADERNLTVAITGAAGYLGGRLARELCNDPRIERVLGYDVQTPTFKHPKFVFDEIDVRNPALEARFSGIDALVHLAFIMDPIKDESMMRDVNVHGSHNVFHCAGRAGVRKIIYTSSAVAYGAHPDNDVPLTEDSPLRANLDFSYAAHKLEVEYVVREFRDEFRDVTMTVFRPEMVLGPHVDSAWSHLFELPIIVGVKGHKPPVQFVHEDDVKRALVFAVFNDLDGPYNLAAPDWLTWEEAMSISGRRRLEVAEARIFSIGQRMWDWGLAEAPAGMLHYVMHPWVVSTEKLRSAGFRTTYDSAEILRTTLERLRPYVRLGPKRVRKSGVALGAAGIGLAGAAAAVRSARARG